MGMVEEALGEAEADALNEALASLDNKSGKALLSGKDADKNRRGGDRGGPGGGRERRQRDSPRTRPGDGSGNGKPSKPCFRPSAHLSLKTFRRMPTANAEGLDRIGRGGIGQVSGETRP